MPSISGASKPLIPQQRDLPSDSSKTYFTVPITDEGSGGQRSSAKPSQTRWSTATSMSEVNGFHIQTAQPPKATIALVAAAAALIVGVGFGFVAYSELPKQSQAASNTMHMSDPKWGALSLGAAAGVLAAAVVTIFCIIKSKCAAVMYGASTTNEEWDDTDSPIDDNRDGAALANRDVPLITGEKELPGPSSANPAVVNGTSEDTRLVSVSPVNFYGESPREAASDNKMISGTHAHASSLGGSTATSSNNGGPKEIREPEKLN